MLQTPSSSDLTSGSTTDSRSHEWESLKHKSASAIIWMLLASGWSSIASFVIFTTLARVLGPEPFGVYALATVVFQILSTVAVTGVTDAVIQQKELDEEIADTLFWANLAISAILGTALFLCAAPYAAWSKQPVVEPVLKWLALTLPIEGVAGVHMARQLRAFGHKVISLRTITASLVGGGAAIICALAGWGVWSLVVQAWIGSILTAIFAWSSYRWIPNLRFSCRRLFPLLVFGGSLIVTRVLWVALSRLQDIFIGQFLGTVAVGAYRVAWRLLELIGQVVAQPIGTVAFATFSSVQDDPRKFEAAYKRLLGLASLAVFPLVISVGVLANDIIPFLFGHTWADVVPIVQVLAVMAVPFTVNYFVSSATAARGAAQAVMFVAAVQVVLTMILSYAAAPFGLVIVAAAYVLRSYITLPYQQYVLYKHAGIHPLRTLSATVPPLISSVSMGVSIFLLQPAIHFYIRDTLICVVMEFICAFSFYFFFLLIFGRSVFISTIKIFMTLILPRNVER